MKDIKTNAMRLLDQHRISYQVHTYPHHDKEAVDGVTVAVMLNEDPERVFKTLVTQGGPRSYYVFVIPSAAELDLKKAARLVHEKSLALIPVKELLSVSGYIRGGCSPLGMKKKYPTLIHKTAADWDTIIFSGGQIGCQIEMNPQDLKQVADIQFEDLIRETAVNSIKR